MNKNFENYLAAFQALGPLDRRLVRAVAANILRDRGAEEMGSSDISCQAYSLFRQYGSFSEGVLKELELTYL